MNWTYFIGWLGIFAIGYTYFGYPLIVFLLGKFRRSSVRAPTELQNPTLTIVITVKNGETVIADKLRNTIAVCEAEPALCTKILVASDGSTDRTDEIARSFPRVELIRVEGNNGKEFAQRAAVSQVNSELIFFTDARAILEPGTLGKAIKYFADPAIAAVSTRDVVEGTSGLGERIYVRYEMLLRSWESRLHSIVGLSGSGFIVRRSIAERLQTDIPSDFGLMLAALEQGKRGILATDVPCRYRAADSERDEYQRKVRTVLRGITALFRHPQVMNPRHSFWTSFSVISHKLFRWLVPFFALATIIAATILADEDLGAFLLVALIGFKLIFVAAATKVPALRGHPLLKIAKFIVISNLAILTAWLAFLSGKRITSWNPSKPS